MSDTSPKNQKALQHGGGSRPPRPPKAGELLFEFVRVSDRKHFRCELRFHGESYGWEAQWFDDGGHFASHGAFVTRAAAVAWAEHEREAFEQPPAPVVALRKNTWPVVI
jgi:hypothetical protein